MDPVRELHRAAYAGAADRVAAILEADPSLGGLADAHGKTALHWAAEGDREGCAGVLLDAGADLEAKTSWGASPFDWAATMGSDRVAELLLARGASGLTLITGAALGMGDHVRTVLGSDQTPADHRRRDAPPTPNDHWPSDSAHILGDVIGDALYAAARNGHTAVVELLLNHGASIDAKGVFGGTGLHWAAINGHADTVRLLLSHGANLGILDARFAASPAQWAEEGGQKELAQLLRVG